MTPPQQYTSRLEEKKVLNDKFIQYSFELLQPHRLNFEAGQYLSLKVSDQGERRSYSICSTPDIKHGLELIVDISPGGIGSKYLSNLEFGDQISFLAPMGRFVIPENITDQTMMFVATGSGIAPFRSMILDQLQAKRSSKKMVLHWGVRYVEDLIWLDEFEDLAESFPNFSFHPVISKPVKKWTLCSGRVTDCLSIHQFVKGAAYFLCGNASMISDVSEFLTQKGVGPDRVYQEKFY